MEFITDATLPVKAYKEKIEKLYFPVPNLPERGALPVG
jgi:hypothetical protein